MKKSSRQNLKKRFWKVFSEYIRRRDNGVCISCGKKERWQDCDAGHYIPKTAGLAIYFDEKNVNAQCTYCNRFMHGNLASYAVALRRKYGPDILEELEYKKRQFIKIQEHEYLEFIKIYKRKIDEMRQSQMRQRS